MEPKYLAMLPGELAESMRLAEEKARCTIEVRPYPPGMPHDGFAVANMGLEGSGTPDARWDATIYFLGADIDRRSMIHEALHIRRNWLEQVPRLMVADEVPDDFAIDVAGLENSLEHLTIVPIERAYEPEAADAHWSSLYDRLLATPPAGHAKALRRSLLSHWAMLQLALPHLRANETGRAALRSHGLTTAARKYVQAMKALQSDKRGQILCAIRHYDLPAEGLRIVRYVVADRRVDVKRTK